MRLLSIPAVLACLLGIAGALRAQEEGDFKNVEIPAAEKTQEVEIVLTAAPAGGKVQVQVLASSQSERVNWKIDSVAVTAEFQKALKEADRIYARVAGTKTIERIQASTAAGSDFRIVDCALKVAKVKWIKSSDDWFLETQKLQKKVTKALSLLAENKLDESLATYLEAQKIAEEMQYQTDPFAKAGTKTAAWGGIIEAIQKIQKAGAEAAKGAGDLAELTALLTLQYQYRYAIPELSPSLAPPESKDLDAVMKSTKEQAKAANVKLLDRLGKGEIKLTDADLAKMETDWSLGMLSDLTYTFERAGRHAEAWRVGRQAILTKPAEGTDWRRTLAQDLLYWIAKEEKFTKELSEGVRKKMPDEIRQIWEKTKELDAHIARDAWDAITALKERYKGQAFEPPADPILEGLKGQLPPEEHEEGSHH